jgi:hypothetical protein
MTRTQLNHQIARITGEPIENITALGFSMLGPDDESMEPEDIRLVLACPFCEQLVPYPGSVTAGSEPMAECERCDVYFGFLPEEVCDIPVKQPWCPLKP